MHTLFKNKEIFFKDKKKFVIIFSTCIINAGITFQKEKNFYRKKKIFFQKDKK